MTNLNDRIGLICEIVNRKPKIGKTALMKIVYLLQQIYKIPLGYRYEIYTYGPYSSEVMSDIDLAKQSGLISVNSIVYPNMYSGYELNCTEKANEAIAGSGDIISGSMDFVEQAIALFGEKSAKDLELITTIIYLYVNYVENGWGTDKQEIITNVRDIKPHFSIAEITAAYDSLEEEGLLAKAV